MFLTVKVSFVHIVLVSVYACYPSRGVKPRSPNIFDGDCDVNVSVVLIIQVSVYVFYPSRGSNRGFVTSSTDDCDGGVLCVIEKGGGLWKDMVIVVVFQR